MTPREQTAGAPSPSHVNLPQSPTSADGVAINIRHSAPERGIADRLEMADGTVNDGAPAVAASVPSGPPTI